MVQVVPDHLLLQNTTQHIMGKPSSSQQIYRARLVLDNIALFWAVRQATEILIFICIHHHPVFINFILVPLEPELFPQMFPIHLEIGSQQLSHNKPMELLFIILMELL